MSARILCSASKCTCYPSGSRLTQTLADIRKWRSEKPSSGETDDQFKNRQNQQWYQAARKNDYRMAKILIPGLSIVTGLAYAYNWIDSSFDSSRWKGDDSLIRNISEYLVIGTVFGSMGGATLWLIYPYPTVLATIVGGGLFIHYAPKIMYTLKKKELI